MKKGNKKEKSKASAFSLFLPLSHAYSLDFVHYNENVSLYGGERLHPHSTLIFQSWSEIE